MMISDLEAQFCEQRFQFLDLANQLYPDAPRSLDDLMARPPQPLEPIILSDLRQPTEEDLQHIKSQYESGYGVLSVVPISYTLPTQGHQHPLLGFADKIATRCSIGIPIDHPMEGHVEAVARFGPPDGTLKIYNLPVQVGGTRYREQAETNEMFHAHNDGLGYAGLIRTAILTLDLPCLNGGYTFFQNIVRAMPALATDDPKAFNALFLPDAIRAVRPRGKGAIRVESPVLFLGREGVPQTFFRVSTGEYRIDWRGDEDLERARRILNLLCAPFGPDSRFVHLIRPGDTVVIANQRVAHGRTHFTDPPTGPGRTLARKWFVLNAEDAVYRHVPGMAIEMRWALLFPDRFTGEALDGEWHFDAETDTNIRVK